MKLFKKMAAVCMAGVMVLSLVACGGASLETGYYKLSSMSEGDTEYTEEQFSSFGLEGYMVVEEGGKGYMYMINEENEFTWDDKNITVQGDPAAYTYSDGTITIDQGDTKMVFKKSTETAPARGAAASDSDDFDDMDLDDIEADDVEETEEADD